MNDEPSKPQAMTADEPAEATPAAGADTVHVGTARDGTGADDG